VKKIFFALRFAVCALCALSLFGLQANGQERGRGFEREQVHPNGIVQDWSNHHSLYPRVGSLKALIAVQHDPRAIQSWQAASREEWRRLFRFRFPRQGVTGSHIDWSISLGTGTTAPAMYPAKFGFDPNATLVLPPTANNSCLADYIVYPVNVTGSGTQPNLVGFNNLYSGTTGGTGVCNAPADGRVVALGADDGVSATTLFSYNITAAGGQVPTSPALSIDGTKIAFVESASGTTAHFHVLAWKSGDGVAANLQAPATSPKQLTSGFAGLAPVASSGTVTDLALNVGTTQSDTLSSPFVDYVNDVAYVGNDSGQLFKILNVFCPAGSACASGGTPAPSLDATWGTGGALATGCAGTLTGAVIASGGTIFVGCSDGRLFGFTPAGGAIAGSPLTVGNGTATGGIVDPPMVDNVNNFVYVATGNSSVNAGFSTLTQASTSSFTSPAPVTADLGAGGAFNLHAPAFNEAYFGSPFASVANIQGSTGGGVTSPGTTSNWQLYEWADSGVVGSPDTLYSVGFSNTHSMTSGAASNFLHLSGSTAAEFSPLTELMNGSTDQLFASGLTSAAPNFLEYNLTDFAGLFPNVLFPINSSNAAGASRTEGNGTSGVTVDNVSSQAQASSVYFGEQGAGNTNAVKLTQSGLN
jgi:hypothetical protein